jgi:hypothetical protein
MLWWEELTGRGGEGVVVKPWDFITSGRRGVIQPAVKCRRREYLRIIYGPEYTLPANLERLRKRGPYASSHWASRRWNASRGANRCAGFMSVFLVCWPWKANQWTPGCERRKI